MSTDTIHNLVIIGSGPAGLTASIYASRAFLKPLVFEGSQPGGQLMGTTAVENWPGEKSIMGPQLMMNMKSQAEHLGANFIPETITAVNFSQKPFVLTTNKNRSFKAHAVIIATGASPNKLGCPGEQEYWGKGVTVCAVCDGAFYPNKRALIIGGGDTAMEDASFMSRYTQEITIVHIKDKLTASPAMQQRVLSNPAIKIIYSSTVTAILGDGKSISGVEVINIITQEKQIVPADVVFLAIGQKPNTHIFKDQLAMNPMGYLELKDQTKSSVEGVFIAGDVADYRYRQAVVSSGSGCMAALDAQRYLEDKGLL